MEWEKSEYLDKLNQRLQNVEDKIRELEQGRADAAGADMGEKARELRQAKLNLENRMRQALDMEDEQFRRHRESLEKEASNLEAALNVHVK
jgi:hypothetical protein